VFVDLESFKKYIQTFLGYSIELTQLINNDLQEKAFPEYVRKPYKIVGTISTNHGVSIEFVEQSNDYEIEVRMVTTPIEDAMLPQKKSSSPCFEIGVSKFFTIQGIGFFFKDFAEKYVQKTSGTNFIINPPLNGFVGISTGDVTFHDCAFGAILNGKPTYREVKGYLLILGENQAENYTIESAKTFAQEVFNASLANYLHPDYRLSIHPEKNTTGNAVPKKLENRIAEFQKLIIQNNLDERKDLQKYFERNPDFLYFGFKYQRIIPQVRLPREGKCDLIPDFLLEQVTDGFCDLLDIKLPSKNILVGKADRRAFSQEVNSAIAQVSEYRDYFDSPKNRQIIEEKYKIKVCKPRVLVLIGNASNIDVEELKKTRDRRKAEAEIVTYDDIINQMKGLGVYFSKIGIMC